MAKKKHEAGKIFVKVMAALLALLMGLLAVSATLIFYLMQ